MQRLRYIIFLLFPLASFSLQAQSLPKTATDSVEIHFRQSKWNLDREVGDNASVLDSIMHRLDIVFADSTFCLDKISITGGASPEGSLTFNKFLSEQRAESIFDYFSRYQNISEADKIYTFLGRDWEGVHRHALADSNLPYQDETLLLLESISKEKAMTGKEPAGSLQRLKSLRNGIPYRYLYRHIFPKVRASKVVLDYTLHPMPHSVEKIDSLMEQKDVMIADTISIIKQECIVNNDSVLIKSCLPFYMDIRTNMAYDLLALPNIGAEFYIGRGFSVGVNWMYAWWNDRPLMKFWRAYGGELNLRWWLNSRKNIERHSTPFSGHHLGLYGQIYTYDIRVSGNNGELGGKPEGNLFDSPFWAAGLEYGYTLPLTCRLSIDFSIGIGYTAGVYHKYRPDRIATGDVHYVWLETNRRKYFGPTKAEIALVWLIGAGNINRKGGRDE